MSLAAEVIEEAYKKNKGIILYIMPVDKKGLSSVAVHLTYVDGAHMFRYGIKETNHHYYGEVELVASGKNDKLRVHLKNNPKIAVDVNGFALDKKSINPSRKHFAYVLPVITKNDKEANNVFRRRGRKIMPMF